ncbi:MAG: YdeI/OmpD-associated family protein [Nocardioides sp.]|nr:YdeI/OmpD-associated family protein [Nocardioides sp.]
MGALHLSRATLEPFGPAGAFLLGDDQVAELGGGRRAAVVVTVGDASVRVRLSVMGGENCIGLSKANRAALGVEVGDVVDAVVSLDEEPREVDVPPELAAVLAAEPEARARYDALAYTHRKEFATWVAEARRQATRDRRAAQTLDMLREGRTRS